MRGREYVLPDDVKELAAPVLAHRIIVDPAARMRNLTAAEVIADVLQRTPLPDAELS